MAMFSALLGGCSPLPRLPAGASNALSGVYANSTTAYEFRNGKFFQYDRPGRTLNFESSYFVKGDKVYIVGKNMDTMIRRVCVVYTISGNQLISSHLEDMDTGDMFYKDKEPKIILTKE